MKLNLSFLVLFGLVSNGFGFGYVKQLGLSYMSISTFYFIFTVFSLFGPQNRRKEQFTVSKTKIDNHYTKLQRNPLSVCFKIESLRVIMAKSFILF